MRRRNIACVVVNESQLDALQLIVPEMFTCVAAGCGRLTYRTFCSVECYLAGEACDVTRPRV